MSRLPHFAPNALAACWAALLLYGLLGLAGWLPEALWPARLAAGSAPAPQARPLEAGTTSSAALVLLSFMAGGGRALDLATSATVGVRLLGAPDGSLMADINPKE